MSAAIVATFTLPFLAVAPSAAQTISAKPAVRHADFSPSRARSFQTPAATVDFTQGSFYVGGKYVDVPGFGTEMDGAMYVTSFIPTHVSHPYPIVLIHGAFGAGGAWSRTPMAGPAGRNSRSKRVRRVCRRSAGTRQIRLYPNIDGPMGDWTVLRVEQLFTAPEAFNLWPQAHLHTQWPSDAAHKGQQGDPVFDTLMRGGLNTLSNGIEVELLNRAAGAALLDKIGPAVVFGRSQGGNMPFLYADARPGMVKAMVDIEGAAPALDCYVCGATPTNLTPSWGLTNTPLTYYPTVSDPSQLKKTVDAKPDGPGLATCWKQATPAHTLTTLRGIPTLVMVAQASFAAQNCCTKPAVHV